MYNDFAIVCISTYEMPFLINQLSVNFERARHVARRVTGNAKCGAHTSPSIARQVRSRRVVMVEEAARDSHTILMVAICHLLVRVPRQIDEREDAAHELSLIICC